MSAPQPRLDEFATARVGLPLEDLSRVQAAQPYQSGGPVVDRAALDELLSGAGRVGADARHTLLTADLVTARGKPTHDGERLAQMRRASRVALRVDAQAAGGHASFEVFVAGGTALVLAGDPAYLLVDPQAQLRADSLVQIELTELTAMPLALVSWLGLAPAWQFAVQPHVLAADLLQARTLDVTTPAPDAADEALLRMWDQPWLRWAVRTTPSPQTMTLLSAGVAGNFVLGAADDGANLVLHSAPPGQVWRDLLAMIDRALNG